MLLLIETLVGDTSSRELCHFGLRDQTVSACHQICNMSAPSIQGILSLCQELMTLVDGGDAEIVPVW